MVLPAFASVDDLDARVPGTITDTTRAQAALDDASALIRAEADNDWVTADEPPALAPDLPDIIVTITVRAALRSFRNPEGVEQHAIGQFSESYSDASSDVYLTANERRLVRKAAGRTSGLGVIPISRGRLEARDGLGDTVYADTLPGPKPIPWASQAQLDALDGL